MAGWIDNPFLDLIANRFFPGIRVETKGATIAGVDDPAVHADQIETHRQGYVFALDIVVYRIDQHRHLKVEVQLAHRGHLGTLVVGRRFLVVNVRFQILRNAPAVIRMRFADVDDIKVNVIPVLRVDFIEVHGPISEGRSRIGTENQPHRLGEARNFKAISVVRSRSAKGYLIVFLILLEVKNGLLQNIAARRPQFEHLREALIKEWK